MQVIRGRWTAKGERLKMIEEGEVVPDETADIAFDVAHLPCCRIAMKTLSLRESDRKTQAAVRRHWDSG